MPSREFRQAARQEANFTISDLLCALVNLDEEELGHIRTAMLQPALAPACEFASWIRLMIDTETRRRAGEDISFPQADFDHWCLGDLAAGLVAANALSESFATGRPSDFFMVLRRIMVCIASQALNDRDWHTAIQN